MKRYGVVALGGTFDILHNGHVELLSKAFSVSSYVIIGLTSDDLATRRGKKLVNCYEKREGNLVKLIESRFPDTKYNISKLDNEFGPAVLQGDVEALVVSDETAYQGDKLNELRRKKNLPSVEVVVVPMVLAEDGTRISTTRIKRSEIDETGKRLASD